MLTEWNVSHEVEHVAVAEGGVDGELGRDRGEQGLIGRGIAETPTSHGGGEHLEEDVVSYSMRPRSPEPS